MDVQTIRLDNWAKTEGIKTVDFLWLDVQGHELPMIHASGVAKRAKVLYMEIHFREAYEGLLS